VTDDDALFELLQFLEAEDYRFTCVSPATHERVLARLPQDTPPLRDIFGWNRPFAADQIAAELLGLLQRGECVEETHGQLRTRVRVASLNDRLFLHSSFPTASTDAVFFGPDTYRFVRFLLAHREELASARRIVDMGAGSGAGGIMAGSAAPSAEIILVEINPAAARLAEVNARFAGVQAEVMVAEQVPAGCDLVIANPPYMMDEAHRTYRDGGALFGGEVALQWTMQALDVLPRAGTMLLYTGAAVIRGEAPLLVELERLCRNAEAEIGIEEIDPDVFSEELDRPQYTEVERIAALGVRIRKPR